MISNELRHADYVEPTFEKFMHSVNLECYEELGLSTDDLIDIDFRAHYETLSILPSWGEWDGVVRDAVEDLKTENGADW